jgi:hypothetical protein
MDGSLVLAFPPTIPPDINCRSATIETSRDPLVFSDLIYVTRATGLDLPTMPSDAANKEYVDASAVPDTPVDSIQFNDAGTFGGSNDLLYNKIDKQITLNGSIVLTDPGSYITGLTSPILPSDAANKAYVDSVIGSTASPPNNAIQFNSGGAFTGSSNLLWDNSISTLGLAGILNSTNTTDATSIFTGAITTAGGASIQKNLYVGSTCHADEYLTTSDENLKDNIVKIGRNDVNKMMKINGYTYDFKNQKKYGILAQELEYVGLNELVKTVDDTKKVNYQSLIPLIIESLKEITLKVDQLDSKNRPLNYEIQARIERLKRRSPRT